MKRISLFTFFIFLGIAGCMAQVSGEKIEKVYVAFKTHLDVGFTDLSMDNRLMAYLEISSHGIS